MQRESEKKWREFGDGVDEGTLGMGPWQVFQSLLLPELQTACPTILLRRQPFPGQWSQIHNSLNPDGGAKSGRSSSNADAQFVRRGAKRRNINGKTYQAAQ
ncbi:hypothetical protein MPTK1_5g15780 [Marchantia polymorpha subsp. ruderalis]|uniref:Uncharacterized protein n=2 Tax=Marchantia polymorpha TaxID=3197 RepID=A0AAF6BIS2_MARPO|nr:hypothetical protein MARPO_0071s0032 [Marchantia polymorpha]BBN11906.1 hypothetical protein Mp_5g15780 [Marchantia polymorpha subsp. ruderalis]|eukprot:PTQ35414.1 hypothetical protein MARPO_0071s0032 [Marchantia polymorpha]